MDSPNAGSVRFGRRLARALLLRCPLCGSRSLFVHWLRMRDVCPGCGLRTDRGEADAFIGGYTINFVTAELVAVSILGATVVLQWPEVTWRALMYVGALLMTALPVAFHPFSRTIWLAVDLTLRPAEEGDFAARPLSTPPRAAG